jgi:hypothetical protein
VFLAKALACSYFREERVVTAAPGAEKCLTCWTDGHLPWCWRGQYEYGEALRDARDLQHAVRWQPPELDLPKLSPPEREQLGLLFDALVARDREGVA